MSDDFTVIFDGTEDSAWAIWNEIKRRGLYPHKKWAIGLFPPDDPVGGRRMCVPTDVGAENQAENAFFGARVHITDSKCWIDYGNGDAE